MKKSLEECIEQYKFYSGRYVDSVCNHEDEMINFYFDKCCEITDYAIRMFNVDLNDVDLTESI